MEFCLLGDLSVYIKQRGLVKRYEPPDVTKIQIQIQNESPPPNLGNEWGGLNEEIVRHFLRQLRSAIEFLRSHSIMHRDLKPQVNINLINIRKEHSVIPE